MRVTLIPQDHVRDALMAYLGNELRRQVARACVRRVRRYRRRDAIRRACVSPIKLNPADQTHLRAEVAECGLLLGGRGL